MTPPPDIRDVTELTTPRLRLRPLRAADLAELHRHWTEPEVLRYLWDGRTVSMEEVGAVIRTSEAMFQEHGAGLWRVTARDAEELLGCAGYWFYHEPPQLELLFSLSARHWGRGYAREAAAALIDFAFDERGWEAVQASADAPNEASLRVMRGLGMKPCGHVPGEFGTIDIHRITRREWAAAKRGASAAPARP